VISSVMSPLGNGKSVEETKRVKGGWPDPVEEEKSKDVPDLIPAKYRKSVTRTKTTKKREDMPASVTLANGETAKIFKRETPDRVEETTVAEVLENNVTALTGKQITNSGQLATTSEQIVADGTIITPSATVVDGSVEPLGNGFSVMRTVQIPDVFQAKSVSKSKPDNIPAKFQADKPTTITEETTAGTIDTVFTLAPTEESRSEDQVTVHTKRIKTATRDDTTDGTLTGSKTTSQFGGGVAAVTETLVTGDMPSATTGLGVLASEVTPLGGGRFVKQTVELESLPSLSGQDYRPDLDVALPYTEEVVAAGTTDEASDIQPIDYWRSKKRSYDFSEIQSKLSGIHLIYPTQENISIPNVLNSVEVLATRSVAIGESRSGGKSWSVGTNNSVAVSADLAYDITEGYQGPCPAEVHVFFLEQDEASTETILSKCGADSWPQFNPRSTRLVISGAGFSGKITCSQSSSGWAASTGSDVNAFTNVAVIPPCIHDDLDVTIRYSEIDGGAILKGKLDTMANVLKSTYSNVIANGLNDGVIYVGTPATQDEFNSRVDAVIDEKIEKIDRVTANGLITVSPEKLNASSPTSVQPGRYVKHSSVALYGYGMVKVTALVVLVGGAEAGATSGTDGPSGYNSQFL